MRVLLVRLSAMGDIVQCLGATRALARQPDLELHFVVQEQFLPLLEGEEYLTSRVAFDRFGGLVALWHLRQELRRLQPDVALDLQGNWKSALVCWLSGARKRIGAQRRQRREPQSAWLLNQEVSWPGPAHPARMAEAVARGLVSGLKVGRPRLAPTEAALDAASADLRAAGVDPDQPFTLFVVTAAGDPRSWHVSAMRRQLELEIHPVVFLLGPDVLPVGLPAGARRIVHGAGRLPELVALGHLVARAGGHVMGPDKGPTHVLCAAGARTQVLCGPTEPRRTAPPGAEPLRKEHGPECVPCRRTTCKYSEGPVCMDFCVSESVPD
jgi:lipopolysaccharide heptosyltransferase I